MDKHITPKQLRGTVTVPPSKSQAHRAVIAACLSQGESRIENLYFSQDISATLSAMEALGATASQGESSLRVKGAYPDPQEGITIDCCESGSTLRFLIPLALVSGKTVSFTGRGRLMERPLDPYFALCEQDGIRVLKSEGTVTFSGKLKGGDYALPGNISSQFITGLLFALPLLEKDSTLTLTTEAESVGYIRMTLDILEAFGINIKVIDNRHYQIPGGQQYKAHSMTVEGDYSQGAFFLCANAMGNHINIKGLSETSSQGDKEILSLIKRFGSPLSAITIDASQIPDLVPILAVLASQAEGETQIVNAGRLRIKESDRITSTAALLKSLGAKVEEKDDALIIHGKAKLTGGTVDSFNDHRIAMAAAIAATVAEGEVTILDAGCVKKSYGNFWQDYESLRN